MQYMLQDLIKLPLIERLDFIQKALESLNESESQTSEYPKTDNAASEHDFLKKSMYSILEKIIQK